MNPELEPPDRTTVVRERVQVVAAVLGVALIWTLALWPSGPNGADSQSGSTPRSVTSWSTLSPTGGDSASPDASAPSTIPTVTGQPSATVRVAPPVPRGSSSTAPEPTSTTRRATSSPSPTSTWMPPGQAKKPTPPPRALELVGPTPL